VDNAPTMFSFLLMIITGIHIKRCSLTPEPHLYYFRLIRKGPKMERICITFRFHLLSFLNVVTRVEPVNLAQAALLFHRTACTQRAAQVPKIVIEIPQSDHHCM
jgi:hypothetical protein